MATQVPVVRFLQRTVDLIARWFNVPDIALRMFRAASDMSGLDRNTLPSELIPLNTIQLARGLLNFTALQSLPGWILPYWAERQFDPLDPGFIPRSHLGLSINVTRRNWTAVGNPSCTVEPVVDPRGAVTPLRNGWSIDVWLRCGDVEHYPSRLGHVGQRLVDDVPVVETTFGNGLITVVLTTYTDRNMLVHTATVRNDTDVEETCSLAFAIRPFNAEGVALVNDIVFEEERCRFVIDGRDTVTLSALPSGIQCSNYLDGDPAFLFGRDTLPPSRIAADCPAGLANGIAVYRLQLKAGEQAALTSTVSLNGGITSPTLTIPPQSAAGRWNEMLNGGTTIVTPDAGMNSLLRSSLCSLLMLTDGDSITPGPWTYHQFWFRDAAIMLHALDVFGHHAYTRPVLEGYPARQERDGYFRSQRGEWDSNGQALWSVWQHITVTHDENLLRRLFPSLTRGVEWIRRKRLTSRTDRGDARSGLMPAGLSAEHLGLADHYFWDNWWSIAGIQAYARMCDILGRAREGIEARTLLAELRAAVEVAITAVQKEKGIQEIPAGPARGVDCGMIGTCAAWYPLQELSPEDARMQKTLETLEKRYFVDGLFFQHFIHSGLNPYLTLQVAQGWLYAGDRRRFWAMLSDVAKRASPTLNFPEAIHLRTGGGTMGDGHHGWGAAEFALALRNAFVQERWKAGDKTPGLVLLGGIPPEWCTGGMRFGIRNAPVPGGIVSMECATEGSTFSLRISVLHRSDLPPRIMSVTLPFSASRVVVNGGPAERVSVVSGETSIDLKWKAGETRVMCERGREETQMDHLT